MARTRNTAILSDITNLQHTNLLCTVCNEEIRGAVCLKDGRRVHFGCGGADIKSVRFVKDASSDAPKTARNGRALHAPFDASTQGTTYRRPVRCTAVLFLVLLDELSASKFPLLQYIFSFLGEPQDAEFVRKMIQRDVSVQPRPHYMLMQTDINERMRTVLVDWLSDVHLKFKLQSDTFFRTVSIIDSFLAKTTVHRMQLQLVGVAATSLSAKFSEVQSPTLGEMAYITNRAYTTGEVSRMEYTILQDLDFELGFHTVLAFLRRLFQLLAHRQITKELELYSYYLAELSLLDTRCCVAFVPSLTAGAAVLLAHELNGIFPTWSPAVEIIVGHSAAQLTACKDALRQLVQENVTSPYQAITTKFKTQAPEKWAPIWVVGDIIKPRQNRR